MLRSSRTLELILTDFPFPGVEFYQVSFVPFLLLFFYNSTYISLNLLLAKEKSCSIHIPMLMYEFYADGSLSGGINQEGIDHYNSMIDELIRNGKKLKFMNPKILLGC